MEKRKFQRNNLIYYLKVYDRNTEKAIGRLVDITPEGVMLISEEPLPADVLFDLRMEFPKEIFGEERLDFSARSMWCRKDLNPDYYDTGFKILDVPLEHVLLIKKLVSEYGFTY
jgi:hypothetical protein